MAPRPNPREGFDGSGQDDDPNEKAANIGEKLPLVDVLMNSL
jgi:hypothetical protein